jgi:hypothetical protein
MIADVVATKIPDNERISFRFAEEVIPSSELEAAFLRVKSRLADNYDGPINAFLSSHGFYSHQANIGLVANALEREGVVHPTEADLELLLEEGNLNQVTGLQKTEKALQIEGDERQRQQILASFTDDAPRQGETKEQHQRRIKSNREKLQSMSLEELRQVQSRRLLKSGSAESARGIVKQADTDQRQALYDQRFKPLSAKYVPPNKSEECGVPWSAMLLKKLPPQEIRRLISVFGESQIDSVLNGTKI